MESARSIVPINALGAVQLHSIAQAAQSYLRKMKKENASVDLKK